MILLSSIIGFQTMCVIERLTFFYKGLEINLIDPREHSLFFLR